MEAILADDDLGYLSEMLQGGFVPALHSDSAVWLRRCVATIESLTQQRRKLSDDYSIVYEQLTARNGELLAVKDKLKNVERALSECKAVHDKDTEEILSLTAQINNIK